MTDQDGTAIVERFRQAAFGMVDWSDGVKAIARASGGHIGQLAVISRRGGLTTNIVTGAGADAVAAYFEARGDDPAVNPRTRAMLSSTPLRCLTDDDFVTPHMRDTMPIFRGLFRRLDIPHGMQTRLDTCPEYVAGLVVLRSRSQGPADADGPALLNAAAAGIAGAVRTGILLGMERDASALSTAETLAGAAMLLGRDGRIMSLSPMAEQIVRAGRHLTVRAGRLHPTVSQSHAAFRDACLAATTPMPVARTLLPITLLSVDRTVPPLVADLCPLPAKAAGALSLAQILLSIRLPRPLPAGQVAPPLRYAFGLTAAEADVATLLANGLDLPAIAARRGSTLATVRVQLKAIFAKTGVHRQAELVARLQPYCQINIRHNPKSG